jgi:hypothetical protein
VPPATIPPLIIGGVRSAGGAMMGGGADEVVGGETGAPAITLRDPLT